MEKGQQFYLSKWYLDVVGKRGEVLIGYAAQLQYRGFSIHYQGLIGHFPAQNRVFSKVRFGSASLPFWREHNLTWEAPRLRLQGSWQPARRGIQETLFHNSEGSAEWNCCVPAAHASLSRKGNLWVKGLGYAEHLQFSLEPWKLPIEDLRWGRYISDKHALVWIEWRKEGAPPQRWLYLDSQRTSCEWISEGVVLAPEADLVLILEDPREIRTSRPISEIARKLLFRLPGFKKGMPGRFMQALEQKWLSKGYLLRKGRLEDQGWVVHEWVQFKAK